MVALKSRLTGMTTVLEVVMLVFHIFEYREDEERVNTLKIVWFVSEHHT